MRKMARWTFFGVLLPILWTAASASADPGPGAMGRGGHGGMGHGGMGHGGMCAPGCGQMGGAGFPSGGPDGNFACCPDLTDEQKAEIEKLRTADEGKMISLRKELMRARHDLRGEMMKDDPSGSAVRKLAEKIGELRTDIELARLETQLAIRKVLTPEQRDRCLLMGHGRGCFGGDGACRMGPRGGDDGRPGPLMRQRFERFGNRGPGAEEHKEGSM